MQICPDQTYSDEEVRQMFDLYHWLQEKRLTAGQAIKLLNDTKSAILDARHEEANNIML